MSASIPPIPPSSAPEQRSAYPHFLRIPTRWMDNDVYGHVNNVVYYSYFDTVVNQFLVTEAGLDITVGSVIGIVAETMCRFRSSLSFPEVVDAGLRVARIGGSSVRYDVAIFRTGEDAPAASGYFVHVYVDRQTRRPVPVPPRIRTALARLVRA